MTTNAIHAIHINPNASFTLRKGPLEFMPRNTRKNGQGIDASRILIDIVEMFIEVILTNERDHAPSKQAISQNPERPAPTTRKLGNIYGVFILLMAKA